MYTPRVPTLTRAHHFHLLVWRPKSVCAPKIGGWHIFNFKILISIFPLQNRRQSLIII